MRLAVIIPCFNEEETLPVVVQSIPREIAGIDEVDVVVVDDGSSDNTAEVARSLGVQCIVRFPRNRGLAAAFAAGLETALARDADVIVNTDGDKQYPQADIPRLIAPILSGDADIVVGDRQTMTVTHFSPLKKALQQFGSWTIRRLSSTDIPDAASGFRAYSREAALRLNIVTEFSYVIETILQASYKGLRIASLPVQTNPRTRKSRLFPNIWVYVRRSGETALRVYMIYRPLRVFTVLGLIPILAGLGLMARYLYFLVGDINPSGHIQSLIVASVLLVSGVQVVLFGLLAELVAINRKLLEDMLYRLRSNRLWTQHPQDTEYETSGQP